MTQECAISPLSLHNRLRTMVFLLHFEHSSKTSLFSNLSILPSHGMLFFVRKYYNWRANTHREVAGRVRGEVQARRSWSGIDVQKTKSGEHFVVVLSC